MKLLLTSQALTNQSIKDALADMLDKPFAQAKVSYIITSHNGATVEKSWLMDNLNSVYQLGWDKFYIIDVAGMDGLPQDFWRQWLQESDVIVMGGGANYILSYWLERTGLLQDLPELLQDKIYVGASAGSMLVTPSLCTPSQAMKAYSQGDWGVDLAKLGYEGRSSTATLHLVNFLFRPHYKAADYPYMTDELFAELSRRKNLPLYALDDNSALKVVDGEVEVVSEGQWKLFRP